MRLETGTARMFPTAIANIFSDLPSDRSREEFKALASSTNVRIERIVSYGHATPEGEWYDQERDEWVLLLSGSAGLLFEGDEAPRVMHQGDYVMIPAHCRHRVAWTDSAETSIWLAVHFGEQPGRG
jgi:cupin 2 domain-containing protein